MNKETVRKNVCTIKECGRPTHKKSKYCIFHASVEEKDEEEFREALKKYIKEIEEKGKDYDFERFIFIGDINFREDLDVILFKNADFGGATFKGRFTNFSNATFEGYACFREATFEGIPNFSNVIFKEFADFTGATFEEGTGFIRATFEGGTGFIRATFEGGTGLFKATFEEANGRPRIFEGTVNFILATFKETADFTGATFGKIADFGGATFKGYACFREATFGVAADFGKVTFEKDASFKSIFLNKNDIDFSAIKILPGNILSIKINNKGGKIYFKRAYLENIDLDIELVKDILIDFTDALLKNTKIKKRQIIDHILQEKNKNYYEAKEIYLLIKNNFHSIGRYEDESWAFKKEKDMERKGNFHFKTFHKWLWSYFLNIIFGYGEEPIKVMASTILIILFFTFLFMGIGINNIDIKYITTKNFFDCFYFSTVTFTTLGYGDFRPLEGWGRILAGTEAFIGALMMALFVYTFARRTGGR